VRDVINPGNFPLRFVRCYFGCYFVQNMSSKKLVGYDSGEDSDSADIFPRRRPQPLEVQVAN